MLQWLKKRSDFEIVKPTEWVKRLEACEGSDHSAMKLLGLWKEAYGENNNDTGEKKERPKFAMEDTKKKVKALRDVKPLDEGYVIRMWAWIQANVK
jgi:hypothetical protein